MKVHFAYFQGWVQPICGMPFSFKYYSLSKWEGVTCKKCLAKRTK
jgi:hypothetical protein